MTTETRAIRFWKGRGDFLGIGIALAIYAAIVIPYFSYVPLWDSADYLEDYLFRPRDHFSLTNFLYTHNGHPSFGYYWPFWIGQKLFPDQLVVVQILNLLIGCLAVIAFGRLVTLAFAERAGRIELGLLTLAFAVSPVFVAYSVNMTIDSGVVAYFLATLWLFYAGRPGWAAVTGVMLVFCKEAGILFYTLIALAYLPGAIGRVPLKKLGPAVVPFAAFAVFFLARKCEGRPFSVWAVNWYPHGTPWTEWLPNPLTEAARMAALGPFVLEFQWILTAFIVAGVVAGCCAPRPVGAPAGRPMGWLHRFEQPLRRFGFLVVGVFYIVSRWVPFVNQRYFLPLYPLLLLCFFAALVQLRLRPALRTVLLAGWVVLQVCCNFRTLDPLSMKITGTFSFGTHPLLAIGTFHNPDQPNRDALVYNLEHTQLGFLLDDAFAAIKPTSETVFVRDCDAWRLWERLDAKTYRRTEVHGPAAISITHLCLEDILAMKVRPNDLDLVELPTFHNARDEALLAPFYDVKRRRVFSNHGYAIAVLEMTRKPAPALAKLPSSDAHPFPSR